MTIEDKRILDRNGQKALLTIAKQRDGLLQIHMISGDYALVKRCHR